MGIRFETTLGGAPINHHIQYAAENRVFHEAAVMLNSSHPRLPEFFKSQMNGEMIDPKLDEKIDEVSENMPVWNRYRLIQDSAYHLKSESRQNMNAAKSNVSRAADRRVPCRYREKTAV